MSVAQNRPDCVALLGFGNVGLGGGRQLPGKGIRGPRVRSDSQFRSPGSQIPSRRLAFLKSAGIDRSLRISSASPFHCRHQCRRRACCVLHSRKRAGRCKGEACDFVGGRRCRRCERHHRLLERRPSSFDASVRNAPARTLLDHASVQPSHLVPLVEVLGGDRTAPGTIETTVPHLRKLGIRPIKLEREMPGYLTNRLQFALLREAVHCLVEGVASAKSIEDAVKYGLAPRWMVMGSLMTLTLAGGPGGMRRVFESFSGAIDAWWEALGRPRMTPEVETELLRAADETTQGRDLNGLISLRDENLVAILRAAAALNSI